MSIFAMVMILGSLVSMAVGAAYAIKHRKELKKKSGPDGDVGSGSQLPAG